MVSRETAGKAVVPPVASTEVNTETDQVKSGTFRKDVTKYLEDCKSKVKSNTHKTKRTKLYRAADFWKDKDTSDITWEDVEACIKGIETGKRQRARDGKEDGAYTQAYDVCRQLRTFFKWALKKKLILVDPTMMVDKMPKPPERDRVLSDGEIRVFWRACDQVGYPFGPALKLLLLTGQRKNEVAELHWQELNLDVRRWTLPATRAKNNRRHIVPLSTFALEIIKSLPHSGATFLFSRDGEKPASDFQKIKKRLDHLMMNSSADAIPAEHWVIHDLRRTAVTGMAKLKVPRIVVEKILNHVQGELSGVAGIYNRHEYLDESAEALEKWASYVRMLVW